MHKIWLVIKREYVTRVRTKGFVFGTIALPLFTVGLFAFSIFAATRQIDHTLKIAILDQAGGLSTAVAQGLNGKLANGKPAFEVVKTLDQPQQDEAARRDLRSEVSRDQLDGYLVIPRDAGPEKPAEFHTKNPGDFSLNETIGRAVSDAVIARRLNERGIQVEKVSDVIRGVGVKLVKVTKEGEAEEKGQTFLVAIVLAMVLYMTLIMYGVVTMRSVLEEKTTRIVEVLVSAVRPFQLLAGTIVGVASVAFTQYMIWIASAALITAYGSAVAAAFRPGAVAPQFQVPTSSLVYLVLYFLLGYFLYASIYAAVGAAASNEQDAQQMQLPATIPLVFSFVMFNYVLRDPNSTTSVVCSEIPFFAPILMTLRISAQTPPLWQIALSILLLVLSTLGVVYFSARIYRVGVLMYGKRPSVVEVFRWLRYS